MCGLLTYSSTKVLRMRGWPVKRKTQPWKLVRALVAACSFDRLDMLDVLDEIAEV